MSRPLVLGLGLLMLATLAFVCLSVNGPNIESDIQQRSQQAALNSGLPSVIVTTSGRDVTLWGSVATDGDRDIIMAEVSKLAGVRMVTDQIEIKATRLEPKGRLQVDYDGQYMALTGTVGDDKSRQTLLNTAADVVGQTHVAEDLQTTASGIANAHTIATALPDLVLLDFAQLLLEGNTLTLQGYTYNPQTKLKIEERMASLLGESFDIVYMIEAPEIEDRPPLDSLSDDPAAQIARCQQAFNERLITEKITFDTGSANISQSSQALIQQLADLVHQCPDVNIEIAGHTDTRGKAKMNQKLSHDRANAVKQALISLGAAPNRLSAVGHGETQPIASEATADGLQKNRRIEFNIKE